ncbi:SMP-30/gluconolactonase/LRE family protein [Haloarchaeobius sp. TZWSO28]|uniref:SMP-30/gluconolactonase/LRE family protein n=1 Tax=Haloarchaeobius sp. TZWSO28 TaxID=3446119 RepID=UPI003EBABCEA
MSWNFQRVAGPFSFTEGPVWDGDGVLFTDLRSNKIERYDPEANTCTTRFTDTNAGNGLKFGPDSRLYVCEGDAHRVACYEPDGSRTTVVSEYEGKRLNAPNDLAFDAHGRLWFTDPDYNDRDGLELGHESVYRVERSESGDWTIDRATIDTTRPNGILVSPDCTELYVAQSKYGVDNDRELRSYPIEPDGSLGEYATLHNFYPHRAIDGMCLDVDGNIVATAGWEQSGPGPMLYVFTPNGRVLETHPFPSDQPTNCTFGGPDLETLYVTAADGYLYEAETDRRGLLGAPPRALY